MTTGILLSSLLSSSSISSSTLSPSSSSETILRSGLCIDCDQKETRNVLKCDGEFCSQVCMKCKQKSSESTCTKCVKAFCDARTCLCSKTCFDCGQKMHISVNWRSCIIANCGHLICYKCSVSQHVDKEYRCKECWDACIVPSDTECKAFFSKHS